MYNNKDLNELKRLDFEDFIWIVFAILSIINIQGDYYDKEYIKTNNQIFKTRSNNIFEIVLVVTLFIYIYFFYRNYKFYKKVSIQEKSLYSIKVLGSLFLIVGIICLIYFQDKETTFEGSPAI